MPGSAREHTNLSMWDLLLASQVLGFAVVCKDSSRIDRTHHYPMNCGVFEWGFMKSRKLLSLKSSKIIKQMRTLSDYM